MAIRPGFHAIAGFAKADMECVKKEKVAILQLTKEPRQKMSKKEEEGR